MQNNPNRNEAKFIKVKEQMENAKRTYEVLNSELHDELPALHDSRILFLVTNMQTLFAAEEVFHSETAKVGKNCTTYILIDLFIISSLLRSSVSLKPLEINWPRRFRREHCPGKPSPSPLQSQTPSSAITPPTQRCKKITFSDFMTLLIKHLAYLFDGWLTDPFMSICSVALLPVDGESLNFVWTLHLKLL